MRGRGLFSDLIAFFGLILLSRDKGKNSVRGAVAPHPVTVAKQRKLVAVSSR